MTNSLPLVSIGALNYNNSKFVIDALNSVAAQTYDNTELIIIDDGSRDDSLEKIKNWLKSYHKPYKLIEHVQNKGIHEGYASILKNASGEYLSLFATDDMLHPNKIKTQIEVFLTLDDSYGIVYGDMQDVDENAIPLRAPSFARKKAELPNWKLPQGEVFSEMIQQYFFYVQAALFRKKIIDEHGFYFPEKFTSEDWYFLLFMTRYSKVFGINEIATYYRVHCSSLTHDANNSDKYHHWALSNTRLFIWAAKFKENSPKEKMAMSIWAQGQLLRYAYHPAATYSKAMATWIDTLSMPGLWLQLKSFVYIHWFSLKKLLN